MTERSLYHDHEKAFQEDDGGPTALGADLFLWQERQKRQEPISFPGLVYGLVSRRVFDLSSENRHMLFSTLGTIGGFTIDTAIGALTGVRPGVDPTIHMMVFALGTSLGLLLGAKKYLEGMNG